MPFKVIGNTSGNVAEVDAGHNLNVTLPQDSDRAGYARVLSSDGRQLYTTENGALNVSTDDLLFFEQVDGAAINTNVWQSSASTMTIAQASGFITLNSGASTTGSAYAILQSIRSVPLYGHLPVRLSMNLKVPILPQSNQTMEIGFGTMTTTAAPTDGVFFRWTPQAELRAVINNAGNETTIVLDGVYTSPNGESITLPPIANSCYLYDIVIVEDLVQFMVDDVIVAEIEVPAGSAYPTNAGRLPIAFRTLNSASAPSAAPQISLGQVVVVQQGVNQFRPWLEVLAAMGRGSYQSPVTTFAQTANHANSASPSSASLSNTAAGYTTLGGRYQFAAPNGAATDFALFGYQVPAGYQLFITGIKVSAINTGAAVAVTATILDWSIGVNASAVSLATADGAGTWAPRRIPLGMQGFLAVAAIGTQAQDIAQQFQVPLVVDGGRFFHVIVQVPVGTATASQVIRGDVLVNGYLE